jgi:hypothetical protein
LGNPEGIISLRVNAVISINLEKVASPAPQFGYNSFRVEIYLNIDPG